MQQLNTSRRKRNCIIDALDLDLKDRQLKITSNQPVKQQTNKPT